MNAIEKVTDPELALTKLRGCDKLCGCGKELIPVIKNGKRIAVTHRTFEDEEHHMNFFSGLRIEIENKGDA